MFKNYLKTALRNLQRNKAYAIINTFGLAIGIAACLLIVLVLQFETSFDNFHHNKEHIYRVGSRYNTQDGVDYSAGTAFPVAPQLRLDFPQIKQIARIFNSGSNQITIDENGKQKKLEANVFYVEPEFFRIFSFGWLSGDANTVLTEPASAAITQEAAVKYFGDWHAALGKTFKYNNDDKQIYKINGILKNIPANSDFPLEVVVSFSTLNNTWVKQQLTDWVSTFGQAYTFVVLPDNYPVKKFNDELAVFTKQHKPVEYQKDGFTAQPLSDIHYDERFGNYRDHTFSKSLITALTLIGIFLIMIACVNFVNLATSQAVNRSKEVGVRKVLGSGRRQLALQFLSETALITLAAIFASILIASFALPFLNKLLEVHMSINFLNSPALILFLLGVFIVVTLLSGFYPAIVISGFNPINALKNKISTTSAGGISVRRGLVVLQFVIAHILIIGTLIVVSQMKYFRDHSLGFDKQAIVNVQLPHDSISHLKFNYLKDRLLQNPSIKMVSFSYRGPSAEGNWNSDFKFDHSVKNSNFSANLKMADVDYFRTYNMQFVAGRAYYPSDTVREFVVNETLLRKLGITDPKLGIGKEMNFWEGKMVGPIVGVVRDFNSYSLREPMAPVVLSTWRDVYQTINVKLKEGDVKPALSFIETEWNKTFPDYIYKYEFLDETINNFYKQESQLSQLYKIFAAIAIFISCLGLYGLVSFMVVQRTKEVGIRKVLGANVRNIVYLLSREFTLLVIIAFVIATPVAFYIMHKWLQNYSYRIEQGISIYLFAIISSMLIAWITVGHRAIKAALANPVKSLRTE